MVDALPMMASNTTSLEFLFIKVEIKYSMSSIGFLCWWCFSTVSPFAVVIRAYNGLKKASLVKLCLEIS